MAERQKFIRFQQITTTSVITKAGDENVYLFGLDPEGRAWQYQMATEQWVPLSNKKKD